MIFEGSRAKYLDAAKLNQEALADIVEQANGKKLIDKAVTLEVNHLAEWSTTNASSIFRLWRALTGDGQRTVQLKVGMKEYNSPLDAVSDVLIDNMTNSDKRSRILDLMTATLSNCCKTEDMSLMIGDVVDGIKKAGFNNEVVSDVRRALKERLKSNGLPPHEKNEPNNINSYQLAGLFIKKNYSSEEDNKDDGSAEQASHRLRYYDEDFYRRRPGVWVKTSVEELRLEVTSFLQEVAPNLASTRHIGDVLANVKALCHLSVDGTLPLPFYLGKPKRHLLALKNGLLDLDALAKGKEPKLLDHDPNWFSTSILPYEFDPEAKCPKFKAFLGQILDADAKKLKPHKKGDNRVKVVQEMVGYSFLPDNRYQKFFALLGKGGNGKGTQLHVWQHLIGAENISSVTLEGMGKEFGQESLIGKMVNMCGDMNEIDNAKEGTLKTWTGEDLVTVYRKYKGPLQAEPTLKFVFSTNALPWFKDKTNGIWRRLIVVPFTFALQSDEEADPNLRPKLRQELPGILNWALRGLTRLLKQGHFTHCKVCAAAAAKHREHCSPVLQFIKDHFTFAADHKGNAVGMQWMVSSNDMGVTALPLCGHREGFCH
ncbi:MAG: DNA primase family protein [Acidimicrobiales bacterium]